MFFENAYPQQPRYHQEFFLRSRPYRGEPPTVAGSLLYPDTPVKMETTTREAFTFRPDPQRNRGKGNRTTVRTQPDSLHSGKGKTGRARQLKECEPGGAIKNHSKMSEAYHKICTTEMKSQYQKDFPPPSSCHMRRPPAIPQPDNIGINPAFRIEFSTVQRDTYHGWIINNPTHPGRLKPVSSSHQFKAQSANLEIN